MKTDSSKQTVLITGTSSGLGKACAKYFAAHGWNVIAELLPHFRKNHRGLILNVSSGAGVFTLPMISLYCASKFALEGFSESLSYELASQNIRVKIIEPGGVLSTNFGKRSGAEAARNVAIADYDAFVAGTNEVFAGLRANRLATEEDVAKVV